MAKRKHGAVSEQPNLKKFRSEVEGLTKTRHKFGRAGPKHHKLSRKEKRKEERQLKKSRKLAWNQGKTLPTKDDVDKAKKEAAKKEWEEVKEKQQKAVKKQREKKKRKKEQQEAEERKQELDIQNKYDDKEIRDLERKLNLNKRKKKTLPKSFIDDGLDYIFDVMDSEKLQEMAVNDEDSDIDKDDFGLNEDVESGSDGDESDKEEEDEEASDSGSDIDGNDDDDELNRPTQKKAKWEELADRIQMAMEKSNAKKKVRSSEPLSMDKDKLDDQLEPEDNSVRIALKEKKNTSKVKDKKKVTFVDDNRSDSSSSEDIDDENLDSEDENENNDICIADGDEDLDESLEERDQEIEDNDNDDDDEEEEEEEDNEDDDNDDSDGCGDDQMEEDADTEKTGVNIESNIRIELKEDIYGRLRDSEGNIVKDNSGSGRGSYVPPAKRLKLAAGADEKKKIQLERLQKQMKGLVNRASEANIQPISSQIENLYLTNSRGDVTDTLIGLILEACISPVMTPERLAMELMMLVAILHGNVGSEVGAVFLQHVIKRYDELCHQDQYGTGKEIDNTVVLLAHLYNFKVAHSVLVFDVVRQMVDRFQERDVELILLLLRHVGFTLRKDDPAGLKQLIVNIQSKASSAEAARLTDQSRVRFMLDVIMAIRNNNMRKIPNYDPEHLDHLRKLIRNYIRGGQFGDNQLNISLEDLLNADSKGKWWIVGSAWEGQGPKLQHKGSVTESPGIGVPHVSSKLEELARKQRMNTDARRNIFYIIMTSEDFVDAFEKLLRVGQKSSQQQDIIVVILDCCLQEKSFNPFYAYLAQKFCEHHRSYQMTFQFCVWDKFKEIGTMSDSNRHNLGKLLTHLFVTKALSLSILKVISFGTLEKTMVRLLKQVFFELLLDHPLSAVEEVFSRIAPLTKLRALHEGLKLFLYHFLVGRKKSETKNPKLLERVEIIDKLLSQRRSNMLL